MGAEDDDLSAADSAAAVSTAKASAAAASAAAVSAAKASAAAASAAAVSSKALCAANSLSAFSSTNSERTSFQISLFLDTSMSCNVNQSPLQPERSFRLHTSSPAARPSSHCSMTASPASMVHSPNAGSTPSIPRCASRQSDQEYIAAITSAPPASRNSRKANFCLLTAITASPANLAKDALDADWTA